MSTTTATTVRFSFSPSPRPIAYGACPSRIANMLGSISRPSSASYSSFLTPLSCCWCSPEAGRRRRFSINMPPSDDLASVAQAKQFEVKQLYYESDFETLVSSSDGIFTVCGIGSLLSEKSAKSTFPDLVNFRLARLNGFRRVFAHVPPFFFENGIARPETKEMGGLSAEPSEGDSLIVTVFEIKKSEIPAFLERETEYRFLAVLPETLDGKPFDNLAEAWKCFFSLTGNIALISVLAAKNLGDEVYDNFLDHTFLGDRKTTIRQHLAAEGLGIMDEEPPETLRHRFGG